MKELSVKTRFFSSVSPLKYFLLTIGIEWNSSEHKTGRLVLKVWCVLCLIVDVVTSMYNFERNSEFEILNIFVDGQMEPTLMSLMRIVDRLNKLACNIITHLLLFFSVSKVYAGFLDRLEKVDYSLSRPNISRFRHFSLFGIVWMLILVSLFNILRY